MTDTSTATNKRPGNGDGRLGGGNPAPDDGPPRIGIKFAPQLQRRVDREPELIAELLNQAAPGTGIDARPAPLFDTVESGRIAELVKRAVALDSTYQPVDFDAWWQVSLVPNPAAELDVSKPDAVDQLIRRVHQLAEVESVQLLRAGPPPSVVAVDDPRSANQGYLDPAPNGIDARYAWGFTGGDGAGIGFVDLEQGWNLNHEDLAGAGVTLISGTNSSYFYHGTSVLGEVLMVDNTVGGVGIAPACTGRVISQHQPSGYNTPATILDAIAHMEFGDVLLIEAQEFDPVDGAYLWPVEVADANFDAIRLATALGITVIEAGCNGSYDLDAYSNAVGQQIFNRSAAGFRDSGAVMVGAAESGVPHTRASFSNFGSRIDCYAWGWNIDTTTTNAAGTDNTAYTTGFNGTSGASPIVVGAALILQGIAQAALGYRFAPLVLRRLLVMGGTASGNPPVDLIGVMPNLRSIIQGTQLNLAPDLYLRDYVGDAGNPTAGSISQSPDIIVRQAPVADPQASFGAGSGTENDPTLSQDVIAGTDHSVYVRLLNRGGSVASAVDVDVYWSPPSTLVTPNLWNLIGTASLASVPTGNVLTASAEVPWPAGAVPGSGHYCFIAVAGNAEDPRPSPVAFTTWDNYVTYVENNNNVAWRNFNVLDAPPAAEVHELSFVIPGAFDSRRTFGVEAIGELPRGSKVELELPVELAKRLRVRLQSGEVRNGRVSLALHPFGNELIGTGILPAGSVASCVLRVAVPKETFWAKGRHEFAVRQLLGDREVGRVTWHFGQAAIVG